MNPVLAIMPGVAFAGGLWLVASLFRLRHPRLTDVLAHLGGQETGHTAHKPDKGGDRLGDWLGRHRLGLSPTLERNLRLKGCSTARHYRYKMMGAVIGLVTPVAMSVLWALAGSDTPVLPLLFSVVGMAVGFVIPDVLLRAQTPHLVADATESLLTYFDLVTLERLANQSAIQALHSAANISQSSLFSHIRAALERARLEQRPPWNELVAVGRELDLPALIDLADVMRLDESGASLAGTLRARVRELRDAHLTDMKVAAHSISERMTIVMVIPSMIFGLIFLAPPLLNLMSHP